MNGPTLWFVRHGETEWSANGQHTSRTDVPLTEAGEREALAVKAFLAGRHFDLVESSPRRRAVRTAELAGFTPTVDDDLEEWDYGDLEGLTTEQIRSEYPGWSIWDGPWPHGEQPQQVAARADRVGQRVRSLPCGATALLFAHGHILRVLAARWLQRPPTDGRLFALGTGTVSVLGWEHGAPAMTRWNIPPGLPASTEAWTSMDGGDKGQNSPPWPDQHPGNAGATPPVGAANHLASRDGHPHGPAFLPQHHRPGSPSQVPRRDSPPAPSPLALAPTPVATSTRTAWPRRYAVRANGPSAPTAWSRPRSGGIAGSACRNAKKSPSSVTGRAPPSPAQGRPR